MILAFYSVKWVDPRTWPFILWVWLALLALGNSPAVWKWYRKRRALESWTTTSAKIELAHVGQPTGVDRFFNQRRNTVRATLDYSYVVEGERQMGRYERVFADKLDAEELLRDLEGKPVPVRFNPSKPSESLLPDEDVDTLVANRAPSPEFEAKLRQARRLPSWTKPLLWPLVLFGVVGLIASLSLHIAALFGCHIVSEALYTVLQLGIFVVFVPAIFIAQKTQRGFEWKSLVRNAPEWMQLMDWIFGIYATINFIIFFVQTEGYSKPNPATEDWRLFSGHLMAFYSVALSVLYPAAMNRDDQNEFGAPERGTRPL